MRVPRAARAEARAAALHELALHRDRLRAARVAHGAVQFAMLLRCACIQSLSSYLTCFALVWCWSCHRARSIALLCLVHRQWRAGSQGASKEALESRRLLP